MVQMTYGEAKKIIPKVKQLLKTRIERKERDLVEIETMAKRFEEQLQQLSMIDQNQGGMRR